MKETQIERAHEVDPDLGQQPSSSAERVKGSEEVKTRVAWLREMRQIRNFEDHCHSLFAKGLILGSTHLGQGQEGVAVGACHGLRETDSVTATYRGHAATLAMGAPLDRAFGEILGKANGLCGGRGGSMHLADAAHGAMGSFAIVGAHLPVTVGFGFAAKYKGTDAVSVCFFGDGSTNIGAFHESLNLAAVWQLPVVFICENNLYGEYSPLASTTPIAHLATRSESYGMPGIRIDGNAVGEVSETVGSAVARARAGEGPTLIEAMTYRHKGHSRSDPAKYRPEGELERWLQRDPIALLEHALREQGVSEADLRKIESEAHNTVDEALARAESWAEPEPEARFEHVYA